MKKIGLIGFVCIVIFFSCKKKSSSVNSRYQLTDSCLVVDKHKTAVFYYPDSVEMNEVTKKYGEENSETAGDDAAYYNYIADSLLKVKGFSILYTDKKCFLFKSDNKEYWLNKKDLADKYVWGIVIFDGKEPKLVSPVDIGAQLENYYK